MSFSILLLKKTGSIKRFLGIALTLIFSLFLALVYLLSTYQAEHEIDEIFDAQLAHSAFILFNLLGESVPLIDQNSEQLPVIYYGFDKDTKLASDNKEGGESFIYQNKLAYQVFNHQGKLLIKSSSAPDMALAGKKQGYSNLRLKDEMWRVYALYDKDENFWLYVAESESIRDELSEEISWQIILPAVFLVPLFLLLLMVIIRLGLAPLAHLVNSINRREAGCLQAINLDVIPQELSPVLNAINALISRLDDALKREQRLTADTAHELRTPLSVVLIHAQNALNSVNDEDRDNALYQLDQGVKRVARLLEQLLTLSKINPETIPKEKVNFHPLCQTILAEMAIKIINKNQALELVCDKKTEAVTVQASEFLLEILIRNLLDNASQYSPEYGHIKLTIEQPDPQRLVLTVEDSGIGIEPDLYNRLTERFYRQHQQQGKGAGLGLTLVNNIITLHQGELSFSLSSLGGLLVKVSLPVI